VTLNYAQYGELGEPLIILHGLFGSARNWQGIAKQLSDRYTVYALDLRNHGASPHSDIMDYSSMSADVLAFMERHQIECATVLGHSMGGKVAMKFALSSPEKISKLVVVDIAPVAYTHNFDDVLAGFYHVPLDQVSSRKEAERYLAEKIAAPSLRQFLLQNLVKSEDAGYQWRVNLTSIKENMHAIMGFPANEMAAYTDQTLFINGGKSSYLASRYQGVAKDMFPNAEFQTIEGTGHWPHIESPTEFMRLLNHFLG